MTGIHPLPVTEHYLALRRNILTIEPDSVGIKTTTSADDIWAVLMEMGLPQGTVATLVVLRSGDASLYGSTGFNVLGGFRLETVRDASAALFAGVSRYRQYMRRLGTGEEPALPEEDWVHFILRTGDGDYSVAVAESVLVKGEHAIAGLYLSCHEVFAALREAAETPDGEVT